MQAASEALDDFLLEYLQKGPELAGEYSQTLADERAAQATYRADHDRRADLRAWVRIVELARAQLAEFQLATASRSAALQRQLEEAEENRWRTRRGDLEEAEERAPQALPRLRTGRDHRQRPEVPQLKRARRYYGQKGRRCEPALVWSKRRTAEFFLYIHFFCKSCATST